MRPEWVAFDALAVLCAGIAIVAIPHWSARLTGWAGTIWFAGLMCWEIHR